MKTTFTIPIRWLKLILWCSICALLGVLLAKALFGQSAASIDMVRPLDNQTSRILVSGGVSGIWLRIERANKQDANPVGKGGFDPSMTYIISEFKPVIKKLKNDKWEIQFECNICEGLP
jgi:hypothetical protein